MKYVLFVGVDTTGESPDAWVESWNGRGVRIEGMRLRPPAEGRTIRVRDDELLVTDGPFAELAEWIAGYDLIEAADLDEAIEVAGSIRWRPRGASRSGLRGRPTLGPARRTCRTREMFPLLGSSRCSGVIRTHPGSRWRPAPWRPGARRQGQRSIPGRGSHPKQGNRRRAPLQRPLATG